MIIKITTPSSENISTIYPLKTRVLIYIRAYMYKIHLGHTKLTPLKPLVKLMVVICTLSKWCSNLYT